MSLKFSGDTKEIVAATKNAEVLVFDIFANRICTKVDRAHEDEINSVCFANRSHSNLIFTGSDDSLVKVWDRRALTREAGTFVGHSEGVTHVTSKGDGVLLASNAKDQLLKVWDIRKMVDPETLHSVRLPRMTGFDYRWQGYPLIDRPVSKHSHDHSLYTFKGHQVLRTLIRCYFSPLETTGQRYIYSGSKDGKLPIYDLLTGKEAMILKSPNAKDVARDVSWHPTYPVIASTSFDGSVNTWTLQNSESPLQADTREAEDLQTQQERLYRLLMGNAYNSDGEQVDNDDDEDMEGENNDEEEDEEEEEDGEDFDYLRHRLPQATSSSGTP